MTLEQSNAGFQPQGAGDETTGGELQNEQQQEETFNTEQTTDNGPAQEESFFDPASIQDNPELVAAYKQMQGAFTKRMQSLSSQQEKVKAYDEFMRDPMTQIRTLASQYGMQLSNGQQASTQEQEFSPQSWNDVLDHFKQAAKDDILQSLQPFISDIHKVKKQSIESYLDSNYADWRSYEQEMMDLIQQHPTLSSNPDMLYKMAVPDDVITKRATQAAMKKLQGQTESAQMTGKTTTSRKPTEVKKANSFAEAFEMAKAQLAAKGIRPPT